MLASGSRDPLCSWVSAVAAPIWHNPVTHVAANGKLCLTKRRVPREVGIVFLT
jgi:hypothetical protein